MKILVASPHLRFAKAGGAIFPYSLAEGLAKEGYDVILLGLTLTPRENQQSNKVDENLTIQWLEDPVKRGWGRYPIYDGFTKNKDFQTTCESLLDETQPDVLFVNSFNRFGTLVECAFNKNIPVIYIACDLGSACLNEVGLYENDDKRCDGPAETKCIECQTSQFTWFRFILSRIARIFMKAG